MYTSRALCSVLCAAGPYDAANLHSLLKQGLQQLTALTLGDNKDPAAALDGYLSLLHEALAYMPNLVQRVSLPGETYA